MLEEFIGTLGKTFDSLRLEYEEIKYILTKEFGIEDKVAAQRASEIVRNRNG